jgi:hypothetical protein
MVMNITYRYGAAKHLGNLVKAFFSQIVLIMKVIFIAQL